MIWHCKYSMVTETLNQALESPLISQTLKNSTSDLWGISQSLKNFSCDPWRKIRGFRVQYLAILKKLTPAFCMRQIAMVKLQTLNKNYFGTFCSESGKIGPKGVWNLTIYFLFGPFQKDRDQVPDPFEKMSKFLILKEDQLVPKGFRTWPLFFSIGPFWKKWNRVPNPCKTILVPFLLKRTKLVPKGVGS